MKFAGGLIIAFSMYSRIPMPRIAWTRERMEYALCFFPLVGAVMGAALWAFGLFCRHTGLEGSLFYAAAGTALPIGITGGIHMDGFLDVTDARASWGERQQKLEILKDPHIGAFAAVGCGVYLLCYLAAFSLLPADRLPAVGAVYVITRALSAWAVVSAPKAKPDGLAAAFSKDAKKRTAGLAATGYLAVSFWFLARTAGMLEVLVTAGLAAGWFFKYLHMAKKEFGGVTGDLAGYYLQTSELLLLVGLAGAHLWQMGGWI